MCWGPRVFQGLDSDAGDGGRAVPDVVFLADTLHYDHNIVYSIKLASVCLLVLTSPWARASCCNYAHIMPAPSTNRAEVRHLSLGYPSLTAMAVPFLIPWDVCQRVSSFRLFMVFQ